MIYYWETQDLKQLKKAASFSDIGIVALRIQERMPNNIGQVCGPISTGGKENRIINMEIFSKTIEKLKRQKIKLYDQRPLESKIVEVITHLGDKYSSNDLLTEIYKPLFISGKLKTVYFIHNWESSAGSCWEHELAKKQAINIIYLEKDFV